MNFTDPPFLVFIIIVYVLWLLTARNDYVRGGLLLAASLVFYGYYQWQLIFLLLTYCVVDWVVGLLVARSRWPRTTLALGVGVNLVLLAYWKYTPLVVATVARLALSLELPVPPTPTGWIVPMGISFYAFTGIAYMVDVYRRTTPAEPNFWRFTLYISFFPQLVAGPILRAHQFLNDLQPGNLPNQPQSPLEACSLIARGFFKKMVIADRIALGIDPFFAHVGDPTTAGVWSLPNVYLYAFQIYFDFSGYTDIARGLGLMFGFRWPENFNLPYLARSVQDFWRRWHITLSEFLRDYLFIPLGGSRYGWVRTASALMATMLLGGLWHGASWSFLLWGGLHGSFLVIHRCWSKSPMPVLLARTPRLLHPLGTATAVCLTFHCVCFAWCFFRLTTLSHSLACIAKVFHFDSSSWLAGGVADASLWLLLVVYGLFTLLVRTVQRQWSSTPIAPAPRIPVAFRGAAWGFCLSLFLLALLLSPGGQSPPFIYFRF